MVLSVSAAILFGAVVLLGLWRRFIHPFQFVLCSLFGFYLAGTGAAPAISGAVSAFGRWVGHFH